MLPAQRKQCNVRFSLSKHSSCSSNRGGKKYRRAGRLVAGKVLKGGKKGSSETIGENGCGVESPISLQIAKKYIADGLFLQLGGISAEVWGGSCGVYWLRTGQKGFPPESLFAGVRPLRNTLDLPGERCGCRRSF